MGAVVAACEKAGEWKSAVRLLAAARESGLKASALGRKVAGLKGFRPHLDIAGH